MTGWTAADMPDQRGRTVVVTGATNLPLQAFDKNQIWLEIAQLAYELLTWTQLLAWADLVIDGHTRIAAIT